MFVIIRHIVLNNGELTEFRHSIDSLSTNVDIISQQQLRRIKWLNGFLKCRNRPSEKLRKVIKLTKTFESLPFNPRREIDPNLIDIFHLRPHEIWWKSKSYNLQLDLLPVSLIPKVRILFGLYIVVLLYFLTIGGHKNCSNWSKTSFILFTPIHRTMTLFSSSQFFFKNNGPSSASFPFIFDFSSSHYNSYNKYMWKSPSRGWDPNSQPSEHQTPPITTRPWLPVNSLHSSHCEFESWCLGI